MKMVTNIAFSNAKYYRSKSILTGAAVFLAAFLLFIVPTIGKDMVDAEYAMVNDTFPQYHACYMDVDSDKVNALSAHNDIGSWGLSCYAGSVLMTLPLSENAMENVKPDMVYMDENGAALSKAELSEGRLPTGENEIVVSKADLNLFGLEGEIGDTVTLSYQIYRGGGLDYRQEHNFVISGFLKQEERGMILVSKQFLEASIPAEEIRYQFLFQVAGVEHAMTDDVEDTISRIAEQFAIPEADVAVNTPYLESNYIDPSFLWIVIVIMLIVVFAAVLTIYSIYYVSLEQQVQEFGRLKAIGVTNKQIRQIVLREGLLVAVCAVPIGLLFGTLMTKLLLFLLVNMMEGNLLTEVRIKEIIAGHRIPFYHWWIYGLTVVVTFITVYISLLKSMHMAEKIPAVSAMRFQGNARTPAGVRNGYADLTIWRLAKNNILSNRRKSLTTILSMSMTGIFIMIVASVLSCTNPEQMVNENFNGQYEIVLDTVEGDKEHPEWAWEEVRKNNPLNDEFLQEIRDMDGVENVEAFSRVDIGGGIFDPEEPHYISGIPESFADELEKGITKGRATYEDIKSGDKVVLDQTFFYWYPDLKVNVGDTFTFTVYDGDHEYERELEIIAIGDFRQGLSGGNCLIMAKEGADGLCTDNINRRVYVYADQDYDEKLENKLDGIIYERSKGLLDMRTRRSEYEFDKSSMHFINSVCFIFLGVLGAICIMNLINTMISSVNTRRKVFGMMQAVGMSDKQLRKMLFSEGLFYTLGTLLISIGAGSILGYGAFLWAKHNYILDIRTFSYPWIMALVVTVVMIFVQIFLVLMLGRSLKKESVIDRVRFYE